MLCFVVNSTLYNNQINARALIGQSAVGYCAGKSTEADGKIARLLNYYIKAIDHKFSMGYRLDKPLGMLVEHSKNS